MRLEYRLKAFVEVFGKRLRLNLAYDTVLRVYELLGEDVLDADKTAVAFRLLVRNYRGVKRWNIQQKALAVDEIFKQFIITDKKSDDDGKKYMDFKQDADYIYASFLLDYGVDLIEQQGCLDWRRFAAMLGGLSDRTKMREVMSIRAAEIPALTEHNGEYVQQLVKAKTHYALEVSANDAENNVQQGLAKLFGALKAQAKAGGNSVRR